MRIAFAVHAVHKRGGTERCIAELAEGLAANGHQLTFFATSWDPGFLPQATWYRVPMLPRLSVLRYLSFLIANTLVRTLVQLRTGERYDVLHATGPDVLRPTVTTLHCCARAMAEVVERETETAGRQRLARVRRLTNSLSYRLIALFERYVVCRGAERVIAISRVLASQVKAYNGCGGERLVVIPNGVNLDEFSPRVRTFRAEVRRELEIPDDPPVVLFVGYNWERKGLGTLIEALARIDSQSDGPRPLLLVVGGQARPAYARHVHDRLGGRVRFLGPRADLPRLYGAADLCVLPSFEEPFGLPTLEAMACGLPVVVSRRAGVSELITDGVDGLILDDPHDAPGLAGRLERLLRSAEEREHLGARARQSAERHSWAEVVRRTEALYQEILRTRQQPILGQVGPS